MTDARAEAAVRSTKKHAPTHTPTRARLTNTKGSKSRAAASGKSLDSIEANRWLDGFLPYHLYRVTNKLNARLLNRLRVMRINTSQWRVLSVLRAYGPMSLTQVVETSLLEQPTASRVVARLERMEHVSRRASQSDSRIIEISITAAGLEAFEKILPSALKHEALALQDVSPKEMLLLAEILKKIERNITHDD